MTFLPWLEEVIAEKKPVGFLVIFIIMAIIALIVYFVSFRSDEDTEETVSPTSAPSSNNQLVNQTLVPSITQTSVPSTTQTITPFTTQTITPFTTQTITPFTTQTITPFTTPTITPFTTQTITPFTTQTITPFTTQTIVPSVTPFPTQTIVPSVTHGHTTPTNFLIEDNKDYHGVGHTCSNFSDKYAQTVAIYKSELSDYEADWFSGEVIPESRLNTNDENTVINFGIEKAQEDGTNVFVFRELYGGYVIWIRNNLGVESEFSNKSGYNTVVIGDDQPVINQVDQCVDCSIFTDFYPLHTLNPNLPINTSIPITTISPPYPAGRPIAYNLGISFSKNDVVIGTNKFKFTDDNLPNHPFNIQFSNTGLIFGSQVLGTPRLEKLGNRYYYFWKANFDMFNDVQDYTQLSTTEVINPEIVQITMPPGTFNDPIHLVYNYCIENPIFTLYPT
jgi:hypothetical protein